MVGSDDVMLTSPHYPNYYEKDECNWLIKTTPGKQIILRFEDFSIEACALSCGCDYLQVGRSLTY